MRTESWSSKVLALVLAGVVVFLLVRNNLRIHDEDDPPAPTEENASQVLQADYRERK